MTDKPEEIQKIQAFLEEHKSTVMEACFEHVTFTGHSQVGMLFCRDSVNPKALRVHTGSLAQLRMLVHAHWRDPYTLVHGLGMLDGMNAKRFDVVYSRKHQGPTKPVSTYIVSVANPHLAIVCGLTVMTPEAFFKKPSDGSAEKNKLGTN